MQVNASLSMIAPDTSGSQLIGDEVSQDAQQRVLTEVDEGQESRTSPRGSQRSSQVSSK